ncbi:hypothetical protein [Mycobacterium sp. ACS4331]|uniref:hypothetical protein n=1 Tax=Mycobacterium sp. ACS4331 TaxID=1834121 RepID=UPI001E30A5F8|nr:hypothetical protein [Mycobacterium sp. ACS4331]
MTADQLRSGRRTLTKVLGLGLAGVGVAHFTSPNLFEPITKPAFPRRTRQHVYTNGGIETALGLGLISGRTRNAAIVGAIGYLAYLSGNAVRNNR